MHKLLNVAAVVLAAGRSSRMGSRHKLLINIDGQPMIRRVTEYTLASLASRVFVIVGHAGVEISDRIRDLDVSVVANEDFAQGMSTSIRTGIRNLPQDTDGALMRLANMPDVTSHEMNVLIEAFCNDEGQSICVPIFEDRRGNPVLWPRRFFPDLAKLTGDRGAKGLLSLHAAAVRDVAVLTKGVLTDIDAPADFAQDGNPSFP